MTALGVLDSLAKKLVTGKSTAQTHQFIATGNADVGFVALSQIVGDDSGSRWMIPEALYTPIRQDAVLLTAGADNAAARAFLDFLGGPEARAIIAAYGCDTGE